MPRHRPRIFLPLIYASTQADSRSPARLCLDTGLQSFSYSSTQAHNRSPTRLCLDTGLQSCSHSSTQAENRFPTRLCLDTGRQSFSHSSVPRHRPSIVLPLVHAMLIIRCSQSVQKFVVQVCHVATVVMETTQLLLSQFENLLPHQLRIEYSFSVPRIISKCC